MYARSYSNENNLKYKTCSQSILSYPIDKDESVELFLRDLPFKETKSMIIDYAETHEIVDALEIADALQLDVFEVNALMKQLIKEGILKEIE